MFSRTPPLQKPVEDKFGFVQRNDKDKDNRMNAQQHAPWVHQQQQLQPQSGIWMSDHQPQSGQNVAKPWMADRGQQDFDGSRGFVPESQGLQVPLGFSGRQEPGGYMARMAEQLEQRRNNFDQGQQGPPGLDMEPQFGLRNRMGRDYDRPPPPPGMEEPMSARSGIMDTR